MSKWFLLNSLFLGFLFLSVSAVSADSVKNPFQSFLPEKPIKKAAVDLPQDKRPSVVEPPKIEVKIEPPVLILNGLIWNSSRPQAIVDGTVVEVGDTVREVKIKKITRDGVEGDFKGVKVHLKP